MSRFLFQTSKYDKRSKTVLYVDVTVFGKNIKEATKKASAFAENPDDIYLKDIEETPDDT